VLSLGRGLEIAATKALGLALTDLVTAVVGNADATGAAIALQGAIVGARIAESVMLAVLAIEDNVPSCERAAITLKGASRHLLETRVAGSQVLGCRERLNNAHRREHAAGRRSWRPLRPEQQPHRG
jgi:hypothetical protein